MNRGLRFAGALAFVAALLATFATGCPFKAEEYVRRCVNVIDADAGDAGALANPCDDGIECTDDTCNADGICENTASPKEVGCGPGKSSVCDGEGNCVQCVSSADCQANHPTTPACDVKVQRCVECLANADCVTLDPTKPVCDVPTQKCVSCSDGVKNADETDIDCGGPDCGACIGKPCDPTHGCGYHAGALLLCALQEHICCTTACDKKCEACVYDKTGQDNGTCAPVTYATDPDQECTTLGGCGAGMNSCRCQDGVKNGDETDVDCGGATCERCGGGMHCLSNDDCASNVHNCVDGACCDSLCETTCFACNANGQCMIQPSGYPDPTCPNNTACGNPGVLCMGRPGFACGTADGKCLSEQCKSGICAPSPFGKACSVDGDCVTGLTCQQYICS